jgi:hypothetical protein
MHKWLAIDTNRGPWSLVSRGNSMHLLALILTVVSGAATKATAQHAALLHMRGEIAPARAEIEAVLAKSPTDGAALFAAACLALESNNPSSAVPYVSRLERLTPAPPHARVLRALTSRRQRHPQERIDDAVVEAWKEAGRPDLAASPLLPPLESFGAVIPEIDAEVRNRMSPAERLLFAHDGPATRNDFLKLVLEAAATAEKNLLVVNIEILGALTPFEPIPEEFRSEARRAASRIAPVVAAGDHANGYLEVAGWLASGPGNAPLSGGDLALLERAVTKPRFEFPRREMLAQMEQMATRLDPKYGVMRARRAALGAPVPLMRLSLRAEATGDPALRRRAGDLLTAVAKRLESSGTMLERMVSLSLASKGAKLGGDERLLAKARADFDRSRASMNSMTEGQKKLGTWPFAAPWREWDPAREMEHFERFVR